jgi:hypothetical protein
LSERVAADGGFIAFSNVSPGAAFFLDPDAHGHVYHRSGSHAPGGQSLEAMPVTHDSAGDWAMTERFCREVLEERKPTVALMWICDPDHTTHSVPLGSPGHMESLAGADACVAEVVRTVERLRAAGEEILLLVGSDHGHETIGAAVNLDDWLAERGLWKQLEAGDIAVAGAGDGGAALRDRAWSAGAARRARRHARRVVGRRRRGWRRAREVQIRGGGRRGRGRQHGAEARSQSLRCSRQAVGGVRRQASAGRQRPAWRLGPRRDAAVLDDQ